MVTFKNKGLNFFKKSSFKKKNRYRNKTKNKNEKDEKPQIPLTINHELIVCLYKFVFVRRTFQLLGEHQLV